MSKFLKLIFKNENFSLSECTDGFWLYDYVRGMNISIRAKTEQDAFLESLKYYQRRCSKLEKDFKELNTKVQAFVEQFTEEADDTRY